MKFYEIAVGEPCPKGEVKAVLTGEKRPPLKGEWYIDMLEGTAFLAKLDAKTVYHIARLVRVTPVIEYKIEEYL